LRRPACSASALGELRVVARKFFPNAAALVYHVGVPPLVLKPQEIPFDHPDSRYMFQPGAEKPFLSTPAAIHRFREQIFLCLTQLQELARQHDGLDYLQVFEDPIGEETLWFIEDDEGGAITALLPSDY
jgi:hypothetical protein